MNHDEAVKEIAGWIHRKMGYEVQTNPGQEHNCEVDETWPDIVGIDKTGEHPTFIGEVETEESVTSEEAKQWIEYGRSSHFFALFVPMGSCEGAKEICLEVGVSVQALYEYTLISGMLLVTEC